MWLNKKILIILLCLSLAVVAIAILIYIVIDSMAKPMQAQTQCILIAQEVYKELKKTSTDNLDIKELTKNIKSANKGRWIRNKQGELIDPWGNPFVLIRKGNKIQVKSSAGDEASFIIKSDEKSGASPMP